MGDSFPVILKRTECDAPVMNERTYCQRTGLMCFTRRQWLADLYSRWKGGKPSDLWACKASTTHWPHTEKPSSVSSFGE